MKLATCIACGRRFRPHHQLVTRCPACAHDHDREQRRLQKARARARRRQAAARLRRR